MSSVRSLEEEPHRVPVEDALGRAQVGALLEEDLETDPVR